MFNTGNIAWSHGAAFPDAGGGDLVAPKHNTPISPMNWCWVWTEGTCWLEIKVNIVRNTQGEIDFLCYCSHCPQDGPVHPHRQEVNLRGNWWAKIKSWTVSDSFFSCVSSVSPPQCIHLQHSPVFSDSFKQTLGPQARVPSEGWQSSTGNQANYWVEPMSCRGNYVQFLNLPSNIRHAFQWREQWWLFKSKWWENTPVLAFSDDDVILPDWFCSSAQCFTPC